MNIFISFSDKNRTLAHALGIALTENGLTPIIASSVVEPGRRIEEKVQELIRKSEGVVLLGTIEAMNSQWVQQEIGYSKAISKRIFPLRTKDLSVGAMLEGLECFIFEEPEAKFDFYRFAGILRSWALKNNIIVKPKVKLQDEDVNKNFQLIHLNFSVVCPKCNNIGNHVWLCRLCGDWICAECGSVVPNTAQSSNSKGER